MASSLLHAYRNLSENILMCCSSFLEMLIQNLLKCKKKKEEIEIDIDEYRRFWDDEPGIVEDVMERLDLVDCIRASNVCKSWRSVAVNQKKKIKTAQVPWLVLSHRDNHQPRTKSLRFFDFSLGSSYNISLPRSSTTLLGWWYCGSSKGWLVIAKGWYFNPKLVLFNPISGVQLQLPPLRTIPSFKDFLRENNKYDLDYDITCFIEKIELSSCGDDTHTSNNCIVAASFHDATTLAVCRPGDKCWSIFKGGVNQSNICADILFYNGILYALIYCVDENQYGNANAYHSLRIGDGDDDDDDDIVVVKLIPLDVSLRTSCLTLDPHIWVPVNDSEGEWIMKSVEFVSYLVESNCELLIVHRIKNVIGSTIDPKRPSSDVLDLMIMEDVETVAKLKTVKVVIIITMMLILIMSMTMLMMETKETTLYSAVCIMVLLITVAFLLKVTINHIYDNINDYEDYYLNYDHNDVADHHDNEDGEDNYYDANDHNDDQEEEDHDGDNMIDFKYFETSKFEVFKIDDPGANNNNMSVTRLNSLGDRMLFVSKLGSVSEEASEFNQLKKNCIFFVEDEEQGNYRIGISRESGIFYLEDERIERCFPSMNHMSWFSPNL
ncbi:hypothetical protein EZV62_012026 [Acer yangbiense]|uniref:F-box domain-containing protein n=1 Tax=Acer yangbiense TaxID=1000413 RepID=A0A5C7I8T5_9ROSI|nr:hypothetical protein EZV62_012026 [Acer yangbiense]